MTRKLIEHLEWPTAEQRRAALQIINARPGNLRIVLDKLGVLSKMPYHILAGKYNDYKKMVALNIAMETYGVGCIRLSEHDKRYSVYNDVAAEYLETGDIYCPTLVYRYDIVKRWDIISVGDLVETLEHKGYRIK